MKKPSAADGTADLFTGQTNEQAKQDDLLEQPRGPAETIEVQAQRWRNNALFAWEVVSKSWDTKPPEKGIYRLTSANGCLLLETYRLGRDGMAFHWSGLTFPESDLYEITSVFVRASKAKQSDQRVLPEKREKNG